ncbi:hypothetical protein BDV96DRAFT_552010 [Lophiotrema nucula]|uniref:Zn(2)-C6 fungal-type domain-containing protein n=1 Tax=Lophiotrema nucula TaxID=690887 RepID=A0A6A5YWM8_9PLEO|nr:hypothetical protein BDV96DRAFT_552010 [Lophiotrema nucula]
MTRRSAGFVSKRPHRKSKGGCLTCKRKKVKCDEGLPQCAYCALRKLECVYPQEARGSSSTSRSPDSSASNSSFSNEGFYGDEDFDVLFESPTALVPAAVTSAGQLDNFDLEVLNHYRTSTWRYVTVREEDLVHSINRDMLPQIGVAKPWLLYSILSISAAHWNTLQPSPRLEAMATTYRTKMFAAYNKALQSIANEDYESLLVTSLLAQVMVPPPDLPCSDETVLTWVSQYFIMTQGIRILAGLKWSQGIEDLAVFPLFKREIRTLPPPPTIQPPDPRYVPQVGPLGATPGWPNPPATYNKPRAPWQLPAPAFLPPPLLALLRSLVDPPPPSPSAPIDMHRSTLLPVIHALSPIFLSLYYFHLTPDVYVRMIVFPTFLTPEFLALVRSREPRALVIIAWWFAFLRLIPNLWWLQGIIPRSLQAVSNNVMRSNNRTLMDAVDGAFRVVRLAEVRGKEVAAKSVFEGWEGVDWDRGGVEGRQFEEIVSDS